VRLYSRPGNDLTGRFPLIVQALAQSGIRENTKLCIKELSDLLKRLPTAKSDDGLPVGHRLATPEDFA
jgi:hypothetical protein